jgi:hypothetical protein
MLRLGDFGSFINERLESSLTIASADDMVTEEGSIAVEKQ